MKHSINLYSAKLQPQLRLLSLPFVLISWGLVLAIFLAIDGYLVFSDQKLATDLQRLENERTQKSALLSSLQLELENVAEDPKLVEEVAKKQQTARVKNRVYKELAGQASEKSSGFAKLMVDLAENYHSELWLTSIYFDRQSVRIEGAADNSAVIPIWVNNLGRSKYFKGQEFSDTRIYRDDGQQLNFVLSSDNSKNTAQVTNYE
ncbi:PilN domain-containing protein [Paraglaciecola aquimarina]|uniref:PilN domain-containing protein n=1 Tax=Paraglaciecola aquimarina TaxID=1235557 RepID=A0ABU3ST07_9ALTE|nr:PilN domain-containing protein [Paraglaciecola aquimarina]MDU0353130.1 PilN domain-containing protein [Paraglaciecola aquimarina]